MRNLAVFLVFLFATTPEVTLGLSLTSVRIERHTLVGNSSVLECHYDLQGEPLYSVKWYKDGNEFFRFLPKDTPPKQVFSLNGVQVDVDGSNATQVRLIKLSIASTGRYRCEVSAEAPSFQTVSDHGDMMTVAIPREGPRIAGGRTRYQVGDKVKVNCTSGPSRPPATLTWYINGELANQSYVTGPVRRPARGYGETSSVGLEFRVEPHHFKRGDLKLKCLATIASVYWRTNEEGVEGDARKAPALEMSDMDKSVADRVHAATGCRTSPSKIFCLILVRYVLALALTSSR